MERGRERMSVQWSEEQKKVIRLRDRNILVSAAAGSGKTAVLVERIIQMLTDEKKPLDVDQLLIVTYTDAAAAEMKERIRNAIEKKAAEDPENEHLQRQATLIHSAQITTIHSFCLSVIREHFHVLDIDPGFRTADEGELRLLKQDVLDELLEACYVNQGEAFLELVEKLGDGRNDRKLGELVLQVYEYSRSYPQPEKWLAQCTEAYRDGEGVQEHAMEQIRNYLGDMQELLEEGMQICMEADGPYMYAEMLEADQKIQDELTAAGNFVRMYDIVSEIKWKRLSGKKDACVSEEKREQVKRIREQVKKMVKNLKESYFYEDPEAQLYDMKESYKTMRTFTGLVKQFADAFAEKKRRKNLIDFQDMEQFALRILTEEEGDSLVPSLSAREYQEQYAEVMIDEYQDSNLIQEAILTSVSTVSQGKNNIFMVGDVKQSIYRFRLSRPELFLEKYETYSVEDVKGAPKPDRQRIDLHRNFRSRKEVLDSVNDVFRRIMRKELGGIPYDDQAALYPGAKFKEKPGEQGNNTNQTELLLLDTKDWKHTEEMTDSVALEETTRQGEARMIAKRIQELLKTEQVQDKDTGRYRPVQYRDIVILTRSVRGWADVFSAVLGAEGIPSYASSREGYFETYEVSVFLDFLRILDNQRQDLPLAAVLTSPFVGLCAQQMAEIRAAYPGKSFYEAAEEYVHDGQIQEKDPERDSKDQKLRERLHDFYQALNHFREMVPYTSIHELMEKILEETGFGVYMAAMPGGEQRTANLEMLVEKAAVFEGTSYKGLFHFVRYMEQLKKYDVDYGEANIADEQADTVRILSIHKSKGLEFPIVFVAGMGKSFNTQDTTGSIVIHPEWGIGIDAVDLQRRTRVPTFLKKMIRQEVRTDNLGEELRVLYVAMTRAREKLILTGQLPDAEEVLERAAEQGKKRQKEEPLPYSLLAGAKNVLDWILPAICGREAPFEISVISRLDLTVSDLAEEQGNLLAREVLEHWDVRRIYDEKLREHLEEQLRFCYPYEKAGKQKRKFTVSELKKRAHFAGDMEEDMWEEPEVIPLLPQFLKETEELLGASRGSAYHKFLELLDFSKEYEAEALQQVLEDLCKEEKLSQEMKDCIQVKEILPFLHSELGKRTRLAAKAKALYKEQPFVLGVDVREIDPEYTEEEVILVQGIIDVYFEEEGELVVLDYKTDRIQNALELKEKYHTQLDYYARALEQLLEKKVKEKIIYSFTLQEEIKI